MQVAASLHTSPLVSVGLPVYNGEKYLTEAIESVLDQDLADFELIISDNGSTDRTGIICQRWASRDPRVRFHRGEVNRGLAWNFNRVFRLARGRYFLWMAHDDRIERDYLRRCVEVLEEDPQVVLCFTNSNYIDQDGRRIRGVQHRNDGAWGQPSRRFRSIIQMDHKCDAIFGLMRSAALTETRLHGAFADSDRVLLAEMGLRGRFHLISETLFSRRQHSLQVTARNPGRHDRTLVFDPAKAGKVLFPHFRELLELAAAVRGAKLPVQERLPCWRHVLGWAWTYRPRLQGDLLNALRFTVHRVLGSHPG